LQGAIFIGNWCKSRGIAGMKQSSGRMCQLLRMASDPYRSGNLIRRRLGALQVKLDVQVFPHGCRDPYRPLPR
jgi:hypothetical protein